MQKSNNKIPITPKNTAFSLIPKPMVFETTFWKEETMKKQGKRVLAVLLSIGLLVECSFSHFSVDASESEVITRESQQADEPEQTGECCLVTVTVHGEGRVMPTLEREAESEADSGILAYEYRTGEIAEWTIMPEESSVLQQIDVTNAEGKEVELLSSEESYQFCVTEDLFLEVTFVDKEKELQEELADDSFEMTVASDEGPESNPTEEIFEVLEEELSSDEIVFEEELSSEEEVVEDEIIEEEPSEEEVVEEIPSEEDVTEELTPSEEVIEEEEQEENEEDSALQVGETFATLTLLQLGREIIVEAFEEMDETLRKSSMRRAHWTIVKKDTTSLMTTLGNIGYRKTLFIDKNTDERTYLLDRLLQLESHARMTEDVEVAILSEATETCYRKAGEHATIVDDIVSKETAKNKIHDLKFPEAKFIEKKEKKEVEYLYIDADEGHIPLQFFEKKGDVEKNNRNIAEPKLIYVYEGINREQEEGILINPRYFGGIYEGTIGLERLWREVWEYLDSEYDIKKIKKIYLNGDAANWIKYGVDYLQCAVHVLDGFHLKKYLKDSVRYAGELAEDYYVELYLAIKEGGKKHLRQIYKELIALVEEDDDRVCEKREFIGSCESYLLGNFNAAYLRLGGDERVLGSSTEPHISHIFSQRMAMKPMGWSKVGVDKMSRLLIYIKNNGDIAELVKYQKMAIPESQQQQNILSQHDVMMMERKIKEKNRENKYYDAVKVNYGSTGLKSRHWLWSLML